MNQAKEEKDKKVPPSREKSLKKPGRQERISGELIEKIAEGVGLGLRKNEDLASYIGIGETTFYMWKKRGFLDAAKKKHSLYVELLKAMEAAQAKAKAIHSGIIIKAAAQGFTQTRTRTTTIFDEKGNPTGSQKVTETISGKPDWRASLEWLARVHSDEWAAVASMKIDWRTFAKRLGKSDDEIEDAIAAMAEIVTSGTETRISARGDDANDLDAERVFERFIGRLEGKESK